MTLVEGNELTPARGGATGGGGGETGFGPRGFPVQQTCRALKEVAHPYFPTSAAFCVLLTVTFLLEFPVLVRSTALFGRRF